MPKHISGPLLACLGLAAAAAARAETSPWYIGAAQVLSYQTNIYSSASGEIASPVSTTNVVGGFDQQIGRQHAYGSATVGYNYYFNDEVRQLNYTGYGLNAGLDWQTVERLSGTVQLSANQSLANYSLAETPTITERNIQNVGLAGLTAQYGITPRVAIDARYQFRWLNYSADDWADQELRQNVYALGLKYSQTGQLSFGLGYRLQKTRYPYYQAATPTTPAQADEATGNNIDLTANWVASGLSTLDARLSWTDIEHTLNQGQDFNGVTGALGWNYQATGKLSTRLSLIVAPGSGSTFYAFTGGPVVVENSTLNGTLRLSGNYVASGKTSFNGFVALSRNRYGQTTPTGTDYGTDLTTFLGLGVSYLPTRSVTLACNVAYQSRSASQEALTLGQSYDYSGATYSCSGQITLQ